MQVYLRITNRHLWQNVLHTTLNFALFLMVAEPIIAEPLFSVSLSVDGLNDYFATDNIGAIRDAIPPAEGQTDYFLSTQYTESSSAYADMSVRGLHVIVSYPANSTALRFQVPSQGIDLTFQGATRDDSEQLLGDFLENNNGEQGVDILSKLFKGFAEFSPVDPVAGNPASLQAQMTASAFGTATGIGVFDDPGLTPRQTDTNATNNRVPSASINGVSISPKVVDFGGDISFVDSAGYRSTVVTLPIKSSIYFDDPRYALTFDIPLTYMDTQGAKTGSGAFGISFRMPILKNWYLNPSARVGTVVSTDLGAAAFIYSGDLTSLYNLYMGDFKISIGNGYGFYETASIFTFGATAVNYLSNTALKNGVSIEGPLSFTLLDRPTSWQAYIIDTQMFGDKLYVEHYDEIGVSLGTRQSMDSQTWDSLQLGLSWTTGDDYNALKANFSYRF